MLKYLINLIYPTKCMLCGKILTTARGNREDRGNKDVRIKMCIQCMDTPLLVTGHTCGICGKPLREGYNYCRNCVNVEHCFEKGFPVFKYGGNVRKSILNYKFHHYKQYAQSYAVLMVRRISESIDTAEIDVIAYAPVTAKRLKERGYNQCELIAGEIAKLINAPLGDNVIIKIKDTPKQSTLSREERIKNLSGVFEINRNIDVVGKTVLFVDDVYTTGTTAYECCMQIKNAGAKRIYISTIAISI